MSMSTVVTYGKYAVDENIQWILTALLKSVLLHISIHVHGHNIFTVEKKLKKLVAINPGIFKLVSSNTNH